jgi:peptidoglycan/xylan/chitin deacetylase (PgdA/CDA1 family)
MKIVSGIVIAVFFTLSQSCFAAESAQTFHWPNKIKAAVSLSYDDALDSQLDIVIPALNKYRLKSSFYLKLANPSVSKRMPEWRKAAQQGHELGNHTLFHQCSRSMPDREWVQPKDDLDKMSVEQMKDQILVANTMLQAIDGKRERTFTVPCGDQKAGGENYLDAVKQEFVAVKAGGGTGVVEDMNTLDPYAVNVIAPSNVTGKQLIDIVKAAGEKGTMANFTFHGVGGDYIQVSKEAHDELLKFLAEHRDIYWTDTFINIMKYVRNQKNPVEKSN